MITGTFAALPPTSRRTVSARTGRLALSGCRSHVVMPKEVENYLRAYRPRRAYPAGVVDWARELVIASRPSGTVDARVLCVRVCNLGEWLREFGYTLEEPIESLLADGNIESYLAQTQGGSRVGTVDVTGSALRRVRRAVTGERKVIVTGGRTDVESAVTPASDAEIASFLAWVGGIDESSVHHLDGQVLVALVRGGGCTKADLADLDVNAIRVQADGSVTVQLGGKVAREVHVSTKWAGPLPMIASRGTDTGSLFEMGHRRRTGTSALKGLENRYYSQRNALASAAMSALPPFINVNTYRAAWLLDRLASGTRLDHLLREAGLVSAAALDRYLQFLSDSVAPKRAR